MFGKIRYMNAAGCKRKFDTGGVGPPAGLLLLQHPLLGYQHVHLVSVPVSHFSTSFCSFPTSIGRLQYLHM